MNRNIEWTKTLVDLLALAARLESEGQYSLAKLARAAADSLGRNAAYQQAQQPDPTSLVDQIRKVAMALPTIGGSPETAAAFERGAQVLVQERLPLIDEIPHPHVCRTCGHTVLGEVAGNCPTCGAWPETFQYFAPVYWLDALDPRAAQEKLRQMPLLVAGLLDGLPEQALDQQPEAGGWAIRNLVTHLRDAQGVLIYRLELFQEAEHPVLESKAVFEWAAKEEAAAPSTLEIFAVYKAERERLLARLQEIPFEGWWRTGDHKEFGTVSIKQQVSYFASHEFTHLPQLTRLREQFNTTGGS